MSLVFEVTAKTRENRSDASIEYIIVARAMQATSPLINEEPRRVSKLDAAGEKVDDEVHVWVKEEEVRGRTDGAREEVALR